MPFRRPQKGNNQARYGKSSFACLCSQVNEVTVLCEGTCLLEFPAREQQPHGDVGGKGALDQDVLNGPHSVIASVGGYGRYSQYGWAVQAVCVGGTGRGPVGVPSREAAGAGGCGCQGVA